MIYAQIYDCWLLNMALQEILQMIYNKANTLPIRGIASQINQSNRRNSIAANFSPSTKHSKSRVTSITK